MSTRATAATDDNDNPKYYFPPLNTIISDEIRLEKQHRHSSLHVHFDSSEEQQELEVSCDRNPTQLFILMSRQLWIGALEHLHNKPLEAHVWISSRFPNTSDYKWCNLPLHLACLSGQEHPPLTFMEKLIDTYPAACRCRNHEGNLPIHLACECLDLSPRFGLEVEGILAALISAFPESLGTRDSRGRRPIDILEERGVKALRSRHVVGEGVPIIYYMKAQARLLAERHHETNWVNNGGNKSKRRLGTSAHKGIKTVEMLHMIPSDDSAAPRRENVGVRDHSKYTPTNNASQQRTPIAEHSPQFFRGWDQCNNESRESYPGEVSSAPCNPMAPQNITSNASPLATGNPDPFHQLETEFNSMRTNHQTMTERLQKLEMEHTQLQKSHAHLNHQHSEIIAELEEKSKALESSHAMAQVMKSKEKALSSELALTLSVQKKRDIEMNQFKSAQEKEQETMAALKAKLEYQLKVNAELNTYINTSKDTFIKEGEQLRSENDRLKSENKDWKESIDQSNRENEELVKENNSLKVQALRSKTLESKLKDSTAITDRDISELTKESEEMKMQLGRTHSEADKLSAQNIALRAVALKSIKAVSSLQQKMKQISASDDTSEQGLRRLLDNAETVSIKAGHSHKSCSLNARDSLELLYPVINDAQNHQQDTIESILRLLQQSHDIMNLIRQIPSIPHETFVFEPTLSALENSITLSLNASETLNTLWETNERRKSTLMTLSSRESINNILARPGNTGKATDIRDQAAERSSVTHKHVKNLESLSQTVSGLPQMNRLKPDSDKEDVQKHLKMVDDVTSVLQRALSKMVKDAKGIKSKYPLSYTGKKTE